MYLKLIKTASRLSIPFSIRNDEEMMNESGRRVEKPKKDVYFGFFSSFLHFLSSSSVSSFGPDN
jgi:hypothetical protein